MKETRTRMVTKGRLSHGKSIAKYHWQAPSDPLEWLLGGGISTQEFFDKYWEKQPLLIFPASPTSSQQTSPICLSSSLLTADRFDPLLSLRYLQAKFDRNPVLCRKLNVCKYENGGRVNHTPEEPSPNHIWKLYDQGCTLQVFQPQQYTPNLAALLERLERHFGCLVGSNAYLTPPGAQGLAPHHDDVDVFVLQLEGEKTWRLHSPAQTLPREHSGDLELASLGPLLQEVTLTPGAILYMPRGTVHYAKTQDQHSHHLTISTYQQNSWFDFLSTATLAALRRAFDQDERYRRGMPLNYITYMGSMAETNTLLPDSLKEKRKAFIETAATLAQDALNYIKHDETADEMALDFMANRLPPQPNDLPALVPFQDKNTATGPSVRLRFPQHVRLVVKPGADQVLLFFSAGNDTDSHMGTPNANHPPIPVFLSLPQACAGALTTLCTSHPTAIPTADLPGLSEDVISEMVSAGLLEVFPASSSIPL